MIKKKIILLDIKNNKSRKMTITFSTNLNFNNFYIKYAIGKFQHHDDTESIICLKEKQKIIDAS